MDIEKLKRMLELEPLPGEGGYYAESYRSAERFARGSLPKRYSGERSFGTAIYFLLTPETFSALHRLASDEVYHFISAIRWSFFACARTERAQCLR